MKNLMILLAILIPATAFAELTPRVCEVNDVNTLFDGRPIMVGTKLPIIISTDSVEDYECDLACVDANNNYGMITGRDFNEMTGDYYYFSAAGNADVWDWISDDPELTLGITMMRGDLLDLPTPQSGDWFIVDYTATGVGQCNVTFYREFEFAFEISFQNVPTRDFNQNTIVDFPDFAILASHWQKTCGDCEGADLDDNHTVNINDLMLFCEYWLETTN